ncbi:cupin domain-containing protein [Desulfonatronovibrio hydrogenovorans]|uniref:cupin domain-containing protein n=1 Tax=Desulfonatronovibrio hydrogenovorans TaxID=53245 RepID=UPI000691EC63|nr:cupin domain-containing protein [Desulfonatronovibrio hydrogenovorans]
MTRNQPVVTSFDQCHEVRRNQTWGHVRWQTLFSRKKTSTLGLTAGVAEIPPGRKFNIHSHPPAEIYYILEGTGILRLGRKQHAVSPGTAVFIPGNTLHGLQNTGCSVLRFFYVFPEDSIEDSAYCFPDRTADQPGSDRELPSI